MTDPMPPELQVFSNRIVIGPNARRAGEDVKHRREILWHDTFAALRHHVRPGKLYTIQVREAEEEIRPDGPLSFVGLPPALQITLTVELKEQRTL